MPVRPVPLDRMECPVRQVLRARMVQVLVPWDRQGRQDLRLPVRLDHQGLWGPVGRKARPVLQDRPFLVLRVHPVRLDQPFTKVRRGRKARPDQTA